MIEQNSGILFEKCFSQVDTNQDFILIFYKLI